MNLKGKVIHTPTQAIYDAVMVMAEAQGHRTFEEWHNYKEETCISFVERLTMHCDRDYYRERSIPIVSWKPSKIKWL